MIQHVLPIGDTKEHSEEVINHLGLLVCMCNCNPKTITEYMSDNVIFVHNSWDGREGVEWVNEILNQNKQS